MLDVRVLGSGTFSPGRRWTGFPRPDVAGIGSTEKLDGSCAGVSGKVPGSPAEPESDAWSRDGSLGTFPARFAVVD